MEYEVSLEINYNIDAETAEEAAIKAYALLDKAVVEMTEQGQSSGYALVDRVEVCDREGELIYASP